MKMKSCELCKSPARIYCDSDQASLCWNCDSKVHSANFLVARHSRSLLCRVCQLPTPWTASGEKLVPSAVSVCEKCAVDGNSADDHDKEECQVNVDEDDDDYDGDEDGENELELEDGEDNQVVPMSSTPPPAASSSSGDDFTVGERCVLLKRKRENVADFSSEDDVDCSSGRREVSIAGCSTDAIRGKRATLYHFLPLRSEEIAVKLRNNRHRDEISGENKSGAVGASKAARAVGLDLNSSD